MTKIQHTNKFGSFFINSNTYLFIFQANENKQNGKERSPQK